MGMKDKAMLMSNAGSCLRFGERHVCSIFWVEGCMKGSWLVREGRWRVWWDCGGGGESAGEGLTDSSPLCVKCGALQGGGAY